MKANVSLRLAAAVALLAGGCATQAWVVLDSSWGALGTPPRVPAHRAVERVTLRLRGREFEFVGYRTCGPGWSDARVQLVLESGLSVLDVAVHGDEDERISGSAFEAIPHFAQTAMSDLRRTWGSRSVFCIPVLSSSGGISLRGTYDVSDGTRTFTGARLLEGSMVAIAPGAPGATERVLHVTLLGPDLVPQARIDYADFDEEGVPREIHLADLRDGHTLDVEVEEVLVGAKAAD